MTDNPATWETPSPAAAHMGVLLSEWREGEAVFVCDLAAHHMNRHGIPHGGLYSFMIDCAMGYCGAYTGDRQTRQMTLTLSMSINFLSRPKGTRLIATGRRTGGGAKTYFAEAHLVDETGELIATGQGTFRLRSGA